MFLFGPWIIYYIFVEFLSEQTELLLTGTNLEVGRRQPLFFSPKTTRLGQSIGYLMALTFSATA